MEVGGGKHTVPEGVAVEELDGGKKKLSEECPFAVKALLESRGLVLSYTKLVDAIVKEGNTRNVFGYWKDREFDSIIDLFRDDFSEHGVKICLCRRASGSKTLRWLEFIDVNVAKDYVPQYDVANLSGQVIKTCYTKLEFPYGVAVEELKQWKGRRKLRDKIPIYVEKLLSQKGLMTEYEMLVESCIAHGVGSKSKMWNIEKLKEVVEEYRPKFAAKSVELFLCHKQEYISHGQYGGHTEYFRWIEFVDREAQPNYEPQRDANVKDEKCVLM